MEITTNSITTFTVANTHVVVETEITENEFGTIEHVEMAAEDF